MKIALALIFSFYFLIGCKKQEIKKEYRFEKRVVINGYKRTFTIVFPSNYNESHNKFPAIIALHGGGGSAKQMEESYELPAKAEKEKYVMIYPDGIQSNGLLKARTWNAGLCCEFAMENNIDDVGFLSKMIDSILKNYQVDSKKIYAVGMSNGGMMAYRLACELSNKIAAIAPVACTMTTTKLCDVNKTVPIIHFHSEMDENVPFLGGIGIRGINYPAVEKGLNYWATLNECHSKAKIVFENEKYRHQQWLDCKAKSNIELYLTKDGGHSWPGITKVRIGGDEPSNALNANDLIFDFFNHH